MRDLFLMLGVPACGKSTFIKQNNIERYAISADTLRTMFSQGLDGFDNTDEYMPFGYDSSIEKEVWDTLYRMLESRMRRGQTVCVWQNKST